MTSKTSSTNEGGGSGNYSSATSPPSSAGCNNNKDNNAASRNSAGQLPPPSYDSTTTTHPNPNSAHPPSSNHSDKNGIRTSMETLSTLSKEELLQRMRKLKEYAEDLEAKQEEMGRDPNEENDQDNGIGIGKNGASIVIETGTSGGKRTSGHQMLQQATSYAPASSTPSNINASQTSSSASSQRRENVLFMRLTAKEQEAQEFLSQLEEVRSSLNCGLRSSLLDPVVNAIFMKTREQLRELKEKLEQSQQETMAWKFTPDSNTGKKLMAKCRSLLAENKELGNMIEKGRLARLQGQLALVNRQKDELEKNSSEVESLLVDMDEDCEGLQATVVFLQKELENEREENKRLRNLMKDAGIDPQSGLGQSSQSTLSGEDGGGIGEESRRDRRPFLRSSDRTDGDLDGMSDEEDMDDSGDVLDAESGAGLDISGTRDGAFEDEEMGVEDGKNDEDIDDDEDVMSHPSSRSLLDKHPNDQISKPNSSNDNQQAAKNDSNITEEAHESLSAVSPHYNNNSADPTKTLTAGFSKDVAGNASNALAASGSEPQDLNDGSSFSKSYTNSQEETVGRRTRSSARRHKQVVPSNQPVSDHPETGTEMIGSKREEHHNRERDSSRTNRSSKASSSGPDAAEESVRKSDRIRGKSNNERRLLDEGKEMEEDSVPNGLNGDGCGGNRHADDVTVGEVDEEDSGLNERITPSPPPKKMPRMEWEDGELSPKSPGHDRESPATPTPHTLVSPGDNPQPTEKPQKSSSPSHQSLSDQTEVAASHHWTHLNSSANPAGSGQQPDNGERTKQSSAEAERLLRAESSPLPDCTQSTERTAGIIQPPLSSLSTPLSTTPDGSDQARH